MASRSDSKQAAELLAQGVQRQRAGETARAEQLYRSVLQLEPTNAAALALLGALAMAARDDARALDLLERAVRFSTPNAALYTNLGEALRRLERKEEAVVAFGRAVALAPELAAAHYNLGLTLDQLGRRAEAIPAFERALDLDPRLPQGLTLLIEVLRDSAEYQRALLAYERFAPRTTASAELEAAVANVLADIFRIDEALLHFREALRMTDTANLRADYATALVELGQIPEAISELRRALELDPRHVRAHSGLVYLLAFDESADSVRIGEEARRFAQQQTAHLARSAAHSNSREPERRLRIGYVSPDFRLHPCALFTLPLLRAHDASAVEVFCYADVRCPDLITEQARQLSQKWRDTSSVDDSALVDLVQQDQIDVLVNLSMHSAHNRLLAFAQKPAPVQVCWLAYPGTTGLTEMDYRISNPRLDPQGLDDTCYSEQSSRLPDTFWCYAPLSDGPAVGELPAATTGRVTFGSLNSFKKVSQAALALWASVLGALPNSRLVLVAPSGSASQRVLRAFEERGIASERIELVGYAPRQEYLATYQRIDVCLDTTPYCGGTTSLDAFWMGVPVLTLVGRTVVGRSGASQAHNLGLPQLVARTPEQYVQRALELCADLEQLAELRRGLRARMEGSPLMDAPRFARELETAYRAMWRRWCKSG